MENADGQQELPGFHARATKTHPDPACKRIGEVPAGERFEVSIYLKPRNGGSSSRADLAAARAAQHADDFKLVQEFASDHGLTVTATEPAKRLIKLSGTAAAVSGRVPDHACRTIRMAI